MTWMTTACPDNAAPKHSDRIFNGAFGLRSERAHKSISKAVHINVSDLSFSIFFLRFCFEASRCVWGTAYSREPLSFAAYPIGRARSLWHAADRFACCPKRRRVERASYSLVDVMRIELPK